MNDRLQQEAASRLFRSVRAGRSWLRANGPNIDASPVAGCAVMKQGDGDPPVFMLPGAPGSILQLGKIADALAVPMPVYAIKPRGLEEGETPYRTIKEMAEYAIAVIAAIRPAGPYPLVGYSAGGLVALEMAQQLTAAGLDVPFVVLLDTYPSKNIWPLRCHVDILGRQSLRALWALRRYAPAQAWHDASRRLRSLTAHLASSGVGFLPPPPVLAEGSSAASRRVYLASFDAGEAYRPTRYAGKVVFVQPAEVPNLEPRAPEQVWRRFLTDLEVRRVPGSHLGIVETGAVATAAEIARCLEQAGLLPPDAPRLSSVG